MKECIVANEFDLDTENLRSYNYLDEDNNKDSKLVTAYSNQINIIDTKNADEMNTLLENDGQSVNNNPNPNIEYGAGEDD